MSGRSLPRAAGPSSCAGFADTTFAGGGIAGSPFGETFDDRSLFIAMRSSMLARLTDISLIRQLIATSLSGPP